MQYIAPHPLQEKSNGKLVVMLPLILFSDDTSGYKSKKWHKFDSWWLTFAGMAWKENAKISNIHFYCCSDVVSAIDMAEPLVTELLELEQNGIEAYDAMLKLNVLVVAPVICILADNPRASELLNHLGPSSRR